jgi:hypothetical protein
MKTTYMLSLATIITSVGLSFSFCGNNAAANRRESISDKGFAVVELFTSEGCSSCPPADETIIKLAKEFPEHVYFLGYHVDYWDYIGWKDAFDNPAFTQRQNRYAEVLNLASIYTPQAIINGEKELIGSREAQLRNTILEKLKTESTSTIELSAGKDDAGKVTVSYKVANAGKDVLNIALVQRMATTNVKRGENDGKKLNHINIVRELQAIAINKEANSTTTISIPAGLNANDLAIIAFIQNEKTMKISGANEVAIRSN